MNFLVMMKMKINTVCLIVLFVFLTGCVGTNIDTDKQPSRKTNYAALYDPGSANINPKVRPYHASKDETLIFFSVNLNNMMPTPGNDDVQGGGMLLGIKYAIRNAETREIADSATLNYNFDHKEKGVFINYFTTKLSSGNNYFASVIFIDRNKKSYKRSVFDINKKDTDSPGYYFAEYVTNERMPVFDNFLSGNRKIRITSDVVLNDSVWMLRYSADSLLPPAPYNTESAMPKEFKHERISGYCPGDTIKIDTAGFYCFTTDTSRNTGYGIFKGSVFYPWIRQAEDMVQPIKYISTPDEYDSVINQEDAKLGVDKFWYEIAETKDRARELIRVYYNRVQQANQFFTSEKPGWQTDRGMIYVVLGAPHVVYKDAKNEKWMYGAEENYQGLVFNFIRDTASLSDNAFLIIRDKRYKDAWMKAVQSWRNGYAYSVPE
jgi:GWxTD domain-containing protein